MTVCPEYFIHIYSWNLHNRGRCCAADGAWAQSAWMWSLLSVTLGSDSRVWWKWDVVTLRRPALLRHMQIETTGLSFMPIRLARLKTFVIPSIWEDVEQRKLWSLSGDSVNGTVAVESSLTRWRYAHSAALPLSAVYPEDTCKPSHSIVCKSKDTETTEAHQEGVDEWLAMYSYEDVLKALKMSAMLSVKQVAEWFVQCDAVYILFKACKIMHPQYEFQVF